MLAQLVRPLVRTQIQLLAQTQGASSRLTGMIAQWLGYLGVKAEVNQLRTAGGSIQVLLTVGKPEQCTEAEWRKILANIDHSRGEQLATVELTYFNLTSSQQNKVHRLLAHMIRAGNGDDVLDTWHTLQAPLADMGMPEAMLHGIQAALKVPVPLEPLLQDLDAEATVFVLSRAIHIALMDRQINADEDDVLKALYRSLQAQTMAS